METSRDEKKSQQEYDLLEDFNEAKQNLYLKMEKLLEKQKTLKQQVNAAKEGDKKLINQKLEDLEKRINEIPQKLSLIEDNQLKDFQKFVEKRGNALIANALQGKERLKRDDDSKIREKQVIQARKNKESEWHTQERGRLIEEFKPEFIALKEEVIQTFSDEYKAAGENLEQSNAVSAKIDKEISNRESKVYKKLDIILEDRMRKLAPELDKFENKFRESHKGALTSNEKNEAKKKVKKFLSMQDQETIASFENIVKNLKNAIHDVDMHYKDCMNEQRSIEKNIMSSTRSSTKASGMRRISRINSKTDTTNTLKKTKSSFFVKKPKAPESKEEKTLKEDMPLITYRGPSNKN